MDFRSPKAIVVLQIGRLGDMILTTPMFRKLKTIFPETKLFVIASEANSVIAENNSHVDKVFVYRKRPFSDLRLLFSELSGCDIWIDTKPEFSNTSKYFLKIFRPGRSLGYNLSEKLFDIDLSAFSGGEHAVDINLAPARFFGYEVTSQDRIPEINIQGTCIPEDLIVPEKSERTLVLNISAGKAGRMIDSDTWIEVLDQINKSVSLKCLVLSHPDDGNTADQIASVTRSRRIRTDSILEAAAIVKSADFVITPDTSIVHICSAFNTPVTAVFPNVDWNLKRFAPITDYHEIVISETASGIDDKKPQNIINAFMRLFNDVNCGNAESRTRVRKEDH